MKNDREARSTSAEGVYDAARKNVESERTIMYSDIMDIDREMGPEFG